MPTNAPMPGETWRKRERPDRRVRINEKTTMAHVVYEYLPAKHRSPLTLQSTQAFCEEYEFEEAHDE